MKIHLGTGTGWLGGILGSERNQSIYLPSLVPLSIFPPWFLFVSDSSMLDIELFLVRPHTITSALFHS